MWNANDDNEWKPKLGYAKLRLKLKEHAPGFITFRENWPGKKTFYIIYDNYKRMIRYVHFR